MPDDISHLVNNQVSAGYHVSSYSELAQKYWSLTLCRYVPHVLKRFFWIYSGEFDQYKAGETSRAYRIDDVSYMERLDQRGLILNSN